MTQLGAYRSNKLPPNYSIQKHFRVNVVVNQHSTHLCLCTRLLFLNLCRIICKLALQACYVNLASLVSEQLAATTQLLVHLAFPVLLTKNWPKCSSC